MLIFLFLGCFLTPIQAFMSKLYHAHTTYTTGNQTEVIFLSVVVELCKTVFLNLIPIIYYLRITQRASNETRLVTDSIAGSTRVLTG